MLPVINIDWWSSMNGFDVTVRHPEHGDYIWGCHQIEMLLYIGMDDKDNNEIYNGDICEYTLFDHNGSDSQFKGVVKWLGTEFVITQIPDRTSNGEYGINLGWVIEQDPEIKKIGNIYENPELIDL